MNEASARREVTEQADRLRLDDLFRQFADDPAMMAVKAAALRFLHDEDGDGTGS